MRTSMLVVGCLVVMAVALTLAADSNVEIQKAPLTWHQAALADGQDLYGEICATCHGLDAKGNGPAAPALSLPTPDLTLLAMANGGDFPAEAVQKAITGQTRVTAHGSLEMPVWGRAFEDVRADYKPVGRMAFSRMRILALTEYLQSLQVEPSTG